MNEKKDLSIKFLSYITVATIAIAILIVITGCGKVEETYQHDMDIARLNDLKTIGGYLEEYRKITGKYPFVGEADIPTYFYIATIEQSKYIQGGPPYAYNVRRVVELIVELERKLGRKINMPSDPQRVPSGRPNFYIYLANPDTYYLAVHLYSEFSFSKNIKENYNKVEITNHPNPPHGAWNYEDLIKNDDFIKAAGKTPHKPGYVEHLREIREKRK